jgi:hypothetical protein
MLIFPVLAISCLDGKRKKRLRLSERQMAARLADNHPLHRRQCSEETARRAMREGKGNLVFFPHILRIVIR